MDLVIFDQKKIAVPCKYRLDIYKNYLQQVGRELNEKISKNNTIKHVLKQPKIIEALAHQLDQVLIDYIDDDLRTYKKTPEYKQNINKNKRQHLIDYMTMLFDGSKDKKKKNYKNYLFTKYEKDDDKPGIKAILKIISDNYLTALVKALERIAADHKDISKLFFSKKPHEIFLERIDFAGSDLHNGGQSVIILTYKKFNDDISQWSKKLIYKPSTVRPDYILFGNTEALNRADILLKNMNEKHKFQSAVEIINPIFDENKIDCSRIRTQIILPKENKAVTRCYGYLEYFESNPYYKHPSYKEMSSALSKKGENKSSSIIVNSLVNQNLSQFNLELKREVDIIKENRINNTDCVIVNRLKKKNISQYFAQIAAVATVFGITDLHIENVIQNKLLPQLIDNEISFEPGDPSLEKTLLFDANYGAMLSKSASKEQPTFLYNIRGATSPGINKVEKNRLYFANKDKSVKNEPINNDIFKKTYHKTIKLIIDNKDKLLQWARSEIVSRTYVRVAPYKTSYFKSNLQFYRESLYSNKTMQEISLTDIKDSFTSMELDKTSLPLHALYENDDILDNFKGGNIPIYYMRSDSKLLINSKNQVVTEVTYINPSLEKKEMDIKELHYAQTTPLENFYYNLKYLSSKKNTKKLISDADSYLDSIAELSPIEENKNDSETTPLLRNNNQEEIAIANSTFTCCGLM